MWHILKQQERAILEKWEDKFSSKENFGRKLCSKHLTNSKIIVPK